MVVRGKSGMGGTPLRSAARELGQGGQESYIYCTRSLTASELLMTAGKVRAVSFQLHQSIPRWNSTDLA